MNDDGRERKFVQSHLDLLLQSVGDWNERASDVYFVAHLEGADLGSAHLEGASLGRAHLEGANLGGTHLEGAKLVSAHLEGANLGSAHLEGANLLGANFEGAIMPFARLEGANLLRAQLQRTNLRGARLEGAILQGADLEGAILQGANLEGADLRETSLSDVDLRTANGYRLDESFVRNARFSARARDPWSVLRNAYTGPKLLFIICLLVAFAVPYVAKLGFWHSVNAGQVHTLTLLEDVRQRGIDAGLNAQQIDALDLSDQDLESYSLCLTDACESRPTWRVMLGIDQGMAFWLPAVVLIVYNLLRALLTYLVAPMRDAEERSGFSPTWKGKPWEAYGILYQVHRVAFVLGIFALLAFAWNAQYWLRQPVWVPAAHSIAEASVDPDA